MPTILDGKALAQKIRAEVKTEVDELRRRGVTPRLHVALVGDFGPSQIYVRSKEKDCAEVGIETETARLPESAQPQELLELVAAWNQDSKVHGILVQLPLPRQIDEKAVLSALDPRKDVDGLHPANLGRILSGTPWFYPATPSGVLEILRAWNIIVAGKHVVIVGRGSLVGKPLANMLLRKPAGDGRRPEVAGHAASSEPPVRPVPWLAGDATVTVCHSRTQDIGAFTRQADIIVAAAGQAGLIRAEMVRKNTVVIDVGTNRINTETGSKLVGDVDYPAVAPLCSAITPVPGGVGPMTRAMLLKNTVKAAETTMS